MSGSTIGIKVADGSYYPVLEQGFTGRKILTLTTVSDEQTRVQIDLYRGDGGGLAEARYIGSLIIENIPPAPRGEPEIQLSIGLDEDGELDAEASDASTGETQKFSISLETLSDEETYEVPEFRVEEEAQAPAAEEPGEGEPGGEGEQGPEALEESAEPEEFDFEEPPLTGESYPVGEPGRKQGHARRRGPNTFLIVLFCLLGALLLGVVGYIVYRAVSGQPLELFPVAATGQAVEQPGQAGQSASSGQGTQAGSSTAAGQSEAGSSTVEQGQQPAAGGQAASGQVVTSGSGEKPAAPAAQAGVTYRIRKGDTLWDIAATYYRNPWLYPRLARANSIRNPDLIFAGAKIFIPED